MMELFSDGCKEEKDWIWEHEMPVLTRIREQTMSLYDDTNIKPTDCSSTRVMLDNLLAEMDALEEALDKTVNADSELQKEEEKRCKEYQLYLISCDDTGYEWEFANSECYEEDCGEEQALCTGLKPPMREFMKQLTHSDTTTVERGVNSKSKILVKDHLRFIPTIWNPGRPPDSECGLTIDGCTGDIFLHVEMTRSLDTFVGYINSLCSCDP